MKPISASGSIILFLITALSVKAGSLANDALPHREAALTLVDVLRQNEGVINSPTEFKAILPVEVDISDLVSNFNVQFQALEDNVTRLGEKFRIIEEENARLREQLKASNEQKGLVEKELAELKGSAAAGAGAGDDDDDTGSAEEDTVLMQNNGTPGATSFDNNSAASKLPKYAFENTVTYTGQTSGDNYWESEESPNIRGMPQYVWMKFATPHRIAKLGFSSQSNMFAPRRFDIVGSSNCAKRDGDAWKALLHVAESGFPADDFPGRMTKTWSIPQQNRREYACIGLKIESSNSETSVVLKNIQMWEEA